MRLEDMLKDVSGTTQKVVDSNCFQGANTLLENILLIQTKVNEVIKAINDGVIKGDKGDKGDKGETGSKGDKGDTGKATESIQDNVISLDTTWSSTKIDSCFNDLKNIQGVKYGNDVGYQVCKGTHNGIVKDIKLYGKSEVIEGKIVSVGNGNEIEVLSVNQNLFDGKFELGAINWSTGENYDLSKDRYRSINYIQVLPNTLISTNIKGQYFGIVEYDSNKKFIKSNANISTITTTNTTKYIRIVNTVDENIIVTIGNLKPYIPHKQDKKTILFKDTDNTWKSILNLRGIDENNCDIVDSGKGKLVKKYNQMNINKNLNIILNDATKTNTIAFAVVVNDAKPGSFSVSNNKCICSKFKNIAYGIDEVGFSGTSSNAFVFRINKTDLQTQDIEGCKKWLENNSFDIVYELLTYESYEINPIFPNSYENETMILFNTGLIPCKNEFYIDSNLGSLQIETNERLSRIENTMYQSNIAILRGDFRTLAQMYYPNDFIKKEELPNE